MRKAEVGGRSEVSVCYTMRFERTSKHPAARLWRAITDPDELAAWWGMPSARVDLRVGGEYFIEFPPGTGDNLDGIIIRVEPERRLTYVWGVSVVDWKITESTDGCAFSFTHHGQTPGLVDPEGGIAAGYELGFEGLEAFLDRRDSVDPGDEFEKKLAQQFTTRIRAVLDGSSESAVSRSSN